VTAWSLQRACHWTEGGLGDPSCGARRLSAAMPLSALMIFREILMMPHASYQGGLSPCGPVVDMPDCGFRGTRERLQRYFPGSRRAAAWLQLLLQPRFKEGFTQLCCELCPSPLTKAALIAIAPSPVQTIEMTPKTRPAGRSQEAKVQGTRTPRDGSDMPSLIAPSLHTSPPFRQRDAGTPPQTCHQ
jgi:hypothetical protein